MVHFISSQRWFRHWLDLEQDTWTQFTNAYSIIVTRCRRVKCTHFQMTCRLLGDKILIIDIIKYRGWVILPLLWNLAEASTSRPLNYQSGIMILTLSLTNLTLCEILRENVLLDIETNIYEGYTLPKQESQMTRYSQWKIFKRCWFL